jgi:predicted aminopeptidase
VIASEHSRRKRRKTAATSRLPLLLSLIACTTLTGCYYAQLARGQLSLLWGRQPLAEARTDPAYSLEIRQQLDLVNDVRNFAEELGLSVHQQYTSYVDWPDDRIVTTLVRTRAGSLESVPWWFPVVGSLPYKGYFDRRSAEQEADRLRRDGRYDVCVSGVSAYSTLGWLDDPVTRPMLGRGPGRLVETLLHELVHATAFLPGEADFNEGAAQFIGQQSAIRFFESLEARGTALDSSWPSSQRVRATIGDRRLIAEAILDLRDRLDTLEGDPDRPRKRELEETRARERIASLPLHVIDAERAAETARLSDACLSLQGSYARDGPRHAALLRALDGNLSALIDRLRRWAQEDRSSTSFFQISQGSSTTQ